MESLICNSCRKTFSINSKVSRCDCGDYLNYSFEPQVSKSDLIDTKRKGLWRYFSMIPIQVEKSIISFNEGMTPLIQETFFNKNVFIKLDYLFPSGSFKDRGSTVLVSKCKELGIDKIVEDSSGNTACSLSAYCKKAGIHADIYVPAQNSLEKAVQIKACGAKLILIDGDRRDVAKAALSASKTSYYASHSWNPYFLHGTKTFIYEIVEQLEWTAPDIIVLPVGSGTLIMGTYIGLNELFKLGIIKKLPKLIAVQSDRCSPLSHYMSKDLKFNYSSTIAEGIAISHPIRIKQIIQAITETKGSIITVSENEIIDSFNIARGKGYFIEPTSSVVIGAIKKLPPNELKNKTIVTTFTGHGLKSISKIKDIVDFDDKKFS